jgi:hypothetical protein
VGSAATVHREAALVVDDATEGWTRSEMLGYVEFCRQRVRDTLADMTEEKGATPLPSAHRYSGQQHAWIITAAVGQTIEHGSQIRQFVTDRVMASQL